MAARSIRGTEVTIQIQEDRPGNMVPTVFHPSLGRVGKIPAGVDDA
jgi:hypothetical protein